MLVGDRRSMASLASNSTAATLTAGAGDSTSIRSGGTITSNATAGGTSQIRKCAAALLSEFSLFKPSTAWVCC